MFDETDDGYTFRTRAESLQAVKRHKLDAFFRGRKWEILGEFHLPAGPNDKGEYERQQNPFGGWIRHGYIIKDVETGENGKVYYVGNNLLKIIANRYQGVTLPVRRRGRPPKNRQAAPAE